MKESMMGKISSKSRERQPAVLNQIDQAKLVPIQIQTAILSEVEISEITQPNDSTFSFE